ncbi:MAG: hypothetical protein FJ090_23085 [Deltaproteobacteria bacterium]|nr:hypothetical protein [Deltaproteobacteria bacterium]
MNTDTTTEHTMQREQAIMIVAAMFPRLCAGRWTAERNDNDWQVCHRYHGRRRPTVEAFVCADGRVEDIDGNCMNAPVTA